ncbi:MAG: zf-TFIIB domain-containing protein [Armatimonadota bacterium]|nr:zf-TFIIB domain-containing protein [Armatimonadota bacterium]
MKCPVCQENLQIAVRSGIEIDYCPTCRGVWLDRGELDKIIERHIQETQALTRSAPYAYAPEPPESRPKPYTRHDYDEYYEEYHKHKRRKKRDWLEDLFDIFD